MALFGDFSHFGSSWLVQSMQGFNASTGTLVVRGVTIPDIQITMLAVDAKGVGSLKDQAQVSSDLRQFVVKRSDLGSNVITQGDTVTLSLNGVDVTFRVVTGLDGSVFCDFDKYKECISFEAIQQSASGADSDNDWL